MSTVLNQSLGDVLDNYADVIEGGNTHRGAGTAYRGIPGMYPSDEGLRFGGDTPLDVVGTSVSTTTFDVASIYDWTTSRWVKEASPGFWALDAADTNAGQARKITGWNNATNVFTVAPAFTNTPAASDEMTILQGFKRIPNFVDIEAEDGGFESGYDRHFHLTALPGETEPYSGRGVRTRRTLLRLRLRMQKYGREHDTTASAFENVALLAAALELGASPNPRDATHTRALWAHEAAEVVAEDKHKLVVTQQFQLTYTMGAELS